MNTVVCHWCGNDVPIISVRADGACPRCAAKARARAAYGITYRKLEAYPAQEARGW